MMKKILILAAVLALSSACAKHSENVPTDGLPIDFGTWTGTMTKAAKTGWANNDAFDVYGFKWNTGPADQATVFNGDDVTYSTSTTKWSYSPLRIFDGNFTNYTFFAVYPAGQLVNEPNANDYSQRGLFVTNNLSYDGSTEKLLVAKKADVARASYGSPVELHFMHMGSLVDIKFKKHADISAANVSVTSIALSDIKIEGSYTVASYDGSNEPVGATVDGVAGLGWTSTATVNATPAVSPYLNNSTVSLSSDNGVGTANAASLISDLILMPQVLGTASGPKITLSYTITTGSGVNEQTVTFTDKDIYFGKFDITDDEANTTGFIPAWMPGVHYTYYITINANAIQFTADIVDWTIQDGHYYLIN